MENNNRPHSREQSQPQGTVSAHKGESAGTGPVGSGGCAGRSEKRLTGSISVFWTVVRRRLPAIFSVTG